MVVGKGRKNARSVQATRTHPPCAQRMTERWERFLTGIKSTLPAEYYDTVCDRLVDAWRATSAIQDSVQFDLKLGHACSAGACSKPTCELCKNSASKPCPHLFKSKYLLGDSLLPACGTAASVRLVRTRSPGDDASLDEMQMLPPMILQVRPILHVPDVLVAAIPRCT